MTVHQNEPATQDKTFLKTEAPLNLESLEAHFLDGAWDAEGSRLLDAARLAIEEELP